MFDVNILKNQIKTWLKSHPKASESDLRDFCEEIIPGTHYQTYAWIVDEMILWWRYYKDSS